MHSDLIIEARSRDLGGGFMVGRVLPQARQRMVGPFVFFDQMGPMDFAAGSPLALDVKPHPHIGLATVTYLYSGSITHRDSLGYEQEIYPGEVNWMIAGKGITHSERFESARAHGAHMHGIQAWVALPEENEEDEPLFFHYEGKEQLPVWQEDGVRARLVAGTIDGVSSRVKTYSPLFYIHWEMDAGGRRSIPATYRERAIYVAAGSVSVGGHTLPAGKMLILPTGQAIDVIADRQSIVMVLGGEPLGERFVHWNFVSSSRARIEQAREDWRAGRMKLPVGDDTEFVPLPGAR